MVDVIPRLAAAQLHQYARAFRIVIVNGPRQAGKTTLLRAFRQEHGGTYYTFDEAETLSAATTDPETFLLVADRPLILDEVQLGGDALIRAIKRTVDDNQSPGQFVLSGSTRFLTVPTLSESLAGRAVFIDLWTPSLVERTGDDGGVVDDLFSDPKSLVGTTSPWTRDDYIEVAFAGGYPERLRIPDGQAARAWFNGYLRTVTSRDVAEFAHIGDPAALVRLLALVAARAGGQLVLQDVAQGMSVSAPTVRAYLDYLETVFLVTRVPAWSTNLTSRITKAPKVFLTDSGLDAHLLRVKREQLGSVGHPSLGGILETFVLTELLKLKASSGDAFDIGHYRDRDGREVDFILEGPGGQVVAVEVKASASPPRSAFRTLEWLRDKLGDRFATGVLLHLGEHCYSMGDRLLLLPVSALWGNAHL